MKSGRFFPTDLFVLLPDGNKRPLMDYLIPSALFMSAALLLMVSILLPYWNINMLAPQYPKGLSVNVYINQIDGDIREIDGLNHYLGMPSLNEGGKFERSISVYAMAALGLLLFGGVFISNYWAALLAIPALLWPFIFLGDLYFILYTYGHSIDPESALGGAIKPFTPPLFGVGKIGQFSTEASIGAGLILAFIAAGIVLAGLWFHRRAYKPVVEARQRAITSLSNEAV